MDWGAANTSSSGDLRPDAPGTSRAPQPPDRHDEPFCVWSLNTTGGVRCAAGSCDPPWREPMNGTAQLGRKHHVVILGGLRFLAYTLATRVRDRQLL